MPACAVLLVNWNSWDLLARSLATLARQTTKDFRVYVLDNGSTDGERFLSCFRDEFPWVTFIGSDANIGFAAANNRLIEEASDTEWIALLNPDAFPEAEWLETLLQAAQASPQYACFASRLLSDASPDILDGTGDVYHFSGLAWRAGHGRPASTDDAKREVFSPCAAAALFRRSALVEVGGFDEDFFCYFEDVDLGFRLRLAGYRCLFVPQAMVRHVGSGTTGGGRSDFALYHGHRNLVWAYVKNMPAPLFWLFLPAHLLLNLASLLWYSTRGQAAHIIAAKRDALKGIGKMWQKRAAIQRKRKASARDILDFLAFRALP